MWNRSGRDVFLFFIEQFLILLNELLTIITRMFFRLKKYIYLHGIRDTQIKLLGILAIVLTISYIGMLASNFSQVFREFVPWVSGTKAGEIYWQSWAFGIKASGLLFLLMICILLYALARRK